MFTLNGYLFNYQIYELWDVYFKSVFVKQMWFSKALNLSKGFGMKVNLTLSYKFDYFFFFKF